jgi:hypothetical protein
MQSSILLMDTIIFRVLSAGSVASSINRTTDECHLIQKA